MPVNYPIESVANALRLLSSFKDRSAVGVSEAGRELGVARSTAHRLLAMLQEHGYLAQDQTTRAYYPGPELIELGSAVGTGDDLKNAGRRYLETLVSTFGETAHMCVLRARDVYFIDGIESSKPLRAGSRIGAVLPAHATSGGKALLATIDEKALLQLLASEKLPVETPRTIPSRNALLKELRAVRAAGFAVNSGESESDLMAFGCAVIGRGGAARGAITISGPERRMRALDRERVVGALRAACSATGSHLR
jgi:IclR family transcriptional regulator, acetate operon repressor